MRKQLSNCNSRSIQRAQKQNLHQKQNKQSSQYHSLHRNNKFIYQRKCHTPSVLMSHSKSKQHKDMKEDHSKRKNAKPTKSKGLKEKQSKEKLNTSKKSIYHSIKSINKMEPSTSMMNFNSMYNNYLNTSSYKKSPFKHKNATKSRTGANLTNLRHAKHIESQLANLSDSMIKSCYYQENQIMSESTSKKHHAKKTHQKEHHLITESKNLMKNHLFAEAIQSFHSYLNKLQIKRGQPSISIQLQVQYLLGICHFHLNQFEEVVRCLSELVSRDQNYRKNMYLFLAISYKKLGLIDEALLVMGKGVKLYPKYVDLLLLRAKMLAKQKRYYDSIEDLNKAIQVQPLEIQAYISKADCLRNLTQYKQSINIYTQVLKIYFSLEIVLKRAITYIENQQLELALEDLNLIIQKQPKNSQAFLFKGLAYIKNKNYNEAILSYQQAIKFNTSKKATTKALYEIAKLKIQTGDFYGASYTLQRAASLDVDMKVIDKMKTFTDGATFIMKKKYRRGIQLLHTLSKKQHLNEQIRSYLFSFRSYGHFCLNKFASALNDLNQLKKCGFVLDNASEYNMILLQGIILSQNNQFKASMDKFHKASELRSQFGDPLMYKSLCKVAQYNRTPKLRAKNQHLLQQSLKFILLAIDKEHNYNYFYLCALVMYILKDYNSALQQLQQAIQRSDQHVMKHFYLRAMIYAMQQKYQQSFNDLNNVLSISKDLKEKQKEPSSYHFQFDQIPQQKQILEVYLNRAKLFLLFGEKKKAFQDLQTYISLKPLDNEIHTIAGKLLFSIGACEDAIKAYNYSPNIDKNKQTLLARAKCYMVLKQLNLSLKDMQKLIQLDDKLIRFDYCCLGALKEASKSQEENFKSALQKISLAQTFQHKQGNIFSLSDMFFYKGVFNFMLEDFQNAKKFMLKSKNLKKMNNQIQVLPNEYFNQITSQQEYQEIFENKIFTDKQIDYNIALCELMIGQEEKAKSTLFQFQGFNKYIFQSSQCSSQQQINLTPFPTNNRLCSIFPDVCYSEKIRFKLSFCLPTINPPPIVFDTEYKLIEQVSMISIQSRPDAPWIKRNKHGVVFTQNLITIGNEQVDIKTEKSIRKQEDEFATEQPHKIKYGADETMNFQFQRKRQEDESINVIGKWNNLHQFQREQHEVNHPQQYSYHFEEVIKHNERLGQWQDQQAQEQYLSHNDHYRNFEQQKLRMKNLLKVDDKVEERLSKIMKKTQTN